MSKIMVLKFITGEEVIADVVNQTNEFYELDDALAIVMQPSQDGKISTGFLPWLSTIEAPIKVKESSVISSGEPVKDLKAAYQSMFSKIITPSKNIIV